MSTLRRTERIRPGMCGHNSLLAGQIGDWTWDAVSKTCGTDVLRAEDASGNPTYLSFYYYRVRGSRRFHLRSPAFGDELHITTRLFGFGSESVLTLHRIGRSAAQAARPLDPEDFYAFGDPDCLYVENFNRWVVRGPGAGNGGLVRSSPPDFDHRHLPELPEKYSPRHACGRARRTLTFLEHGDRRPAAELAVEYEVDPSRDLNGAGLLYFAAYFSIIDRALLCLWRSLGRDDRSFLDRVVVDQQLCYLGNADAGQPLTVAVRLWERPGGGEAVDVVLRDRDTGRVLAVCSLQLEGEQDR
ncbi:LnmK family bifunctional acyltransferase/decarboxylase [Streptomyces sp. Wb2n-11]|uniref:LnmK family bifunctional acyltransferase/decarboxylase n=1 Tax=Streptomyces sp. Wb2n-11 TaxID=1030533 RepID=UPI000B23B162|nr:LnmK family bifunctional acyltransferase/decarboxylase [Streptomyces sp. Wb2n-11]